MQNQRWINEDRRRDYEVLKVKDGIAEWIKLMLILRTPRYRNHRACCILIKVYNGVKETV